MAPKEGKKQLEGEKAGEYFSHRQQNDQRQRARNLLCFFKRETFQGNVTLTCTITCR